MSLAILDRIQTVEFRLSTCAPKQLSKRSQQDVTKFITGNPLFKQD